MLSTKLGRNIVPALFVLPFLLTSCGGGGGGDDPPPNDGEFLEPPDGSSGPETPVSAISNFEFQLEENFFNTSSDAYLELIVDQIGGAITPLNSIDNVFMDNQVPVIYGECGVANAFYLPQQRQILVCDELAGLAFGYFQSALGEEESETANAFLLEQTFNMMTFIIYHEMGHALDDLRDLSVGGNFESVADAIAVVLSVQTGQPLAAVDAGQFFFFNENVSFADEHGSGEDRAGDIFCWVLGSSPLLQTEFPIISTIFVDAGRDCVAEYANQFDFVVQLLPGLQNIPPRASLKRKRSETDEGRVAALDRLIAARLQSVSGGI